MTRYYLVRFAKIFERGHLCGLLKKPNIYNWKIYITSWINARQKKARKE